MIGKLIQIREGQHDWLYARLIEEGKDVNFVHVIHSGNTQHNVRKHVDPADCRGIDELEELVAIARKTPEKDLLAKLGAKDPFAIRLDPQKHKRQDIINHYETQLDRLQEDESAEK